MLLQACLIPITLSDEFAKDDIKLNIIIAITPSVAELLINQSRQLTWTLSD